MIPFDPFTASSFPASTQHKRDTPALRLLRQTFASRRLLQTFASPQPRPRHRPPRPQPPRPCSHAQGKCESPASTCSWSRSKWGDPNPGERTVTAPARVPCAVCLRTGRPPLHLNAPPFSVFDLSWHVTCETGSGVQSFIGFLIDCYRIK